MQWKLNETPPKGQRLFSRGVFDFFYNCLCNWTRLSLGRRHNILNVLFYGFRHFADWLQTSHLLNDLKHREQTENLSSISLNLEGQDGFHNFNRIRNLLKGYVYLLTQFLSSQIRQKEDGDIKALKKKVAPAVKKREGEAQAGDDENEKRLKLLNDIQKRIKDCLALLKLVT